MQLLFMETLHYLTRAGMAANAKTRKPRKATWLIFVDTNIFLDFYRIGGDSAKRTLTTPEQHSAALILTDPNQGMPTLLNEVQSAKQFGKYQRLATAQHKKVIQKIEQILANPSRHDPVFRSLQKLFSQESPLSLRRPDKKRYAVRRAATKRFGPGYPPRKDDTLRLGVAINWEWIIECALASKDEANVLIVSRDGDFGVRARSCF